MRLIELDFCFSVIFSAKIVDFRQKLSIFAKKWPTKWPTKWPNQKVEENEVGLISPDIKTD